MRTKENNNVLENIDEAPVGKLRTVLGYALLFTIVLSLHYAGFLLYAELTAEEKPSAFRMNIVDDGKKHTVSPTPIIQQKHNKTEQTQHATTKTPSKTIKVEYNVYSTEHERQAALKEQQRKAHNAAVLKAKTEQEAERKRDNTEAHKNAAMQYVLIKKGLYLEVEETKPIAGWEGEYRTRGKIKIYRGTNKIPDPQTCEIMTKETNGKIEVTSFDIRY